MSGLISSSVPDRRRQRGDPSAAFEIFEVFHHEVHRRMRADLGQVRLQLVHRRARAPLLCRQPHLKARAETDGAGIEPADHAVRVALFQRFGRALHAREGRGELVREGHVIDVLPLFQHGLEVIDIVLFVDRGRDGNGSLAHAVKEVLEIGVLAEVVRMLLAVQHVGHADDAEPQLLRLGVPQFTVGIAKKADTSFSPLLFGMPQAACTYYTISARRLQALARGEISAQRTKGGKKAKNACSPCAARCARRGSS